MKKMKNWLFIAVVLTSMCACSSDSIEPQSQVETSVVDFTFFESTIESIDKAKTRADDDASTLKKSFSRLDVAIFPENKNNSKVYRFHQVDTNDGFGSLSVQLPVGKYTLIAIASKAEAEIDIKSAEVATFPSDRVTDMAYTCQKLNVTNSTNTANCALKRSLSRFKLLSTDSAYNDLGSLKITIAGKWGNAFNPTTGWGIANGTKTYTKTWNITKTEGRELGVIDGSLYVLIPEEKEVFTVDVEVATTDGTVRKKVHFDNVTLEQNHVTTYKGALFTTSSTLDFTFDNSAWGESSYDKTFTEE